MPLQKPQSLCGHGNTSFQHFQAHQYLMSKSVVRLFLLKYVFDFIAHALMVCFLSVLLSRFAFSTVVFDHMLRRLRFAVPTIFVLVYIPFSAALQRRC